MCLCLVHAFSSHDLCGAVISSAAYLLLYDDLGLCPVYHPLTTEAQQNVNRLDREYMDVGAYVVIPR